MTLFAALDLGMGSAIYGWYDNGYVIVEEQIVGDGYVITGIKREDAHNHRRRYEQTVADWDELVTRIAALPFFCDPEAGWRPTPNDIAPM